MYFATLCLLEIKELLGNKESVKTYNNYYLVIMYLKCRVHGIIILIPVRVYAAKHRKENLKLFFPIHDLCKSQQTCLLLLKCPKKEM